MSRFLIVNADDFGQTAGINAGVAEAHERGAVTSASLMVRGAAAEEAAAYAADHADFSVGLHLDLGEWVYRDGDWEPAYLVVDADDEAAAAAEVEHQLAAFERLLGRAPTHLDSHQHVHRNQPARRLLEAAGARLGVPVRHLSRDVAYRGDFYGQTGRGDPHPGAITVPSLLALLAGLPPGWTELGCHPGRAAAALAYGIERTQELEVLCDPRVGAALEEHDIALRSFHDVHDIAAPHHGAPTTGGRT